MTDARLTIIATAAAPTLAALGALVVGIINSIKANRIHVLVNSNLTAVKQELAGALDQIKELRKELAGDDE